MDITSLLDANGLPGSPLAFALLCGLAIWFTWQAFAPARPGRTVRERLDGYLEQADVVEEDDMLKPFVARAVLPLVRRLLQALGRLAPGQSMEATRKMLPASRVA